MIETLIGEFLSVNKYCPLPGVGTLVMQIQGAQAMPGGHQMSAPFQQIVLNNTVQSEDKLLSFIATAAATDRNRASSVLSAFCQKIQSLSVGIECNIPCIGSFKKSEEGMVQFMQSSSPEIFMPVVSLKRVVHPNRIHQITVGDNVKEASFLTDVTENTIAQFRSKWWIAAAILGFIGVAAITWHLIAGGMKNISGNTMSVPAQHETSTYSSQK